MKIIARHERDDRDIELDPEQIAHLKAELGIDYAQMLASGIRQFDGHDGWSYTISE